MPIFNQFRHILVEKRHQKRGNVCAVHVRIGHDDNFLVTQVFLFVIVFGAAAQRFNHIFDFLILRNLIQAGTGNVQDFPAQRQNRLRHTVASLLGGSPCRVALDNKYFRILGCCFGTVCQFPRQTQFLCRRFAVLHFFFFSFFAQFGAADDIFNQGAGIFLVRRKPVVK